jgi:protein arginine kinase
MTSTTELSDVAISTRARAMRNLDNRKFPHLCSTPELLEIMQEIIRSVQVIDPTTEVYKSMTLREREQLVAKRLISTNYHWTLPGRAVTISKDESLSVMINEEDHLRVQVLGAGFCSDKMARQLSEFLHQISETLRFAFRKDFGYLASSLFNTGRGTRHSVMLHLVALGYDNKLPEILQALVDDGITIRGLYGEGSRPIGAYAQVSTTSASLAKFVGTCEYLIERERKARRELGDTVLEEKAKQALLFLNSSPKISLLDSFRVLGSLRWAASSGLSGYPSDVHKLDRALATINMLTIESEEHADGKRADGMRKMLLG